jgi:hypothetical protein
VVSESFRMDWYRSRWIDAPLNLGAPHPGAAPISSPWKEIHRRGRWRGVCRANRFCVPHSAKMTGIYNRSRKWPSPDRCRRKQQDNKKNARHTEVAEPGCRRRSEWDTLLDRSGYETFPHAFRQAPIAMVKSVRQEQTCICSGHFPYSVSARGTLKKMIAKFNQLGSSKLIAGCQCAQEFKVVVVQRHLDSPFEAEETFAQNAFLSFSRPLYRLWRTTRTVSPVRLETSSAVRPS